MGKIWISLIGLGILFSFLNGSPQTVTNVLFYDLEKSVEIILSLLPVMAFWTGLMAIVEKSGILSRVSTAIKPIVGFLFKEVQNNTKAVNAIIMTLAANMLGIGNSATAFGIKAMHEMQLHNRDKSTANNAMCMFLIINVSSVQLIPINIIKLRADSGAAFPGDVMVPTIVATAFSTAVAVAAAKYYEGRDFR
ncbi:MULTISPECIES: nucleoside recognition domain-containing protein [unclassified Sedimentibacter]|uniref:nucleoside recognition domain-containing protein n=1 Tax=unclassified Sedimentibacter TaxID=2649220 RepID=UPI0027E07A57|nr:nucleoside recognition domain-containing protein [Sedimentibacter sp. MB35-C1]WMJ75763.1 nucleoside recognition domain-containing protein [Sedimentibacter sp. MB35-C1]